MKLIIFIIFNVCWLPKRVLGFAMQNIPLASQCSDSCVGEMQALIDSTPFFNKKGGGASPGGIVEAARSSFFSAATATNANNKNGVKSTERNIMPNFFGKICDSYEKVDACLTSCEAQNQVKENQHRGGAKGGSRRGTYVGEGGVAESGGSATNLRQVYAGLQFICKERKAEFFDALPCLAQYEPSAMLKCSNEINRSQETTMLFTNSIVNREFHSIQLRFGTLCRDLNMMMKCMEPTIRRGCGDRPTNLMLSFIGLEFSSFEKLNEQLGFDQPLPQACRELIQYSNDRRAKHSDAKAASGTRKSAAQSTTLQRKIGSVISGSPVNRPFSALSPLGMLFSACLTHGVDAIFSKIYRLIFAVSVFVDF